MTNLTGLVGVVTGASSGIGEGLAKTAGTSVLKVDGKCVDGRRAVLS